MILLPSPGRCPPGIGWRNRTGAPSHAGFIRYPGDQRRTERIHGRDQVAKSFAAEVSRRGRSLPVAALPETLYRASSHRPSRECAASSSATHARLTAERISPSPGTRREQNRNLPEQTLIAPPPAPGRVRDPDWRVVEAARHILRPTTTISAEPTYYSIWSGAPRSSICPLRVADADGLRATCSASTGPYQHT
jgi:hypothetical protein